MRLKAATDRPKRVLSLSLLPLALSSATTPAYCEASVSTPTSFQFLAALRTMAGPPMSMFSIASSRVQPGLATVASNGYRFTTSRSMVSMPCSLMAAICSGRSRRASRPPCTLGCRVLTRPSSISGKPVWSATSVTGRPASASSLAVPPVDSSLMPSACSACANSRMPVLSETEMSAVWAMGYAVELFQKFVFNQLFTKRVAVQAQPLRGLRLVALGARHHDIEQGFLDHAHEHLVHAVGFGAAQIAKVTVQTGAHAVFDVFLAHCFFSSYLLLNRRRKPPPLRPTALSLSGVRACGPSGPPARRNSRRP